MAERMGAGPGIDIFSRFDDCCDDVDAVLLREESFPVQLAATRSPLEGS
jgi:hypothetical protein